MAAHPKPLSLAPLSLEEALRRAMSVPAPKSDPKPPPKGKAKKLAKKKGKSNRNNQAKG